MVFKNIYKYDLYIYGLFLYGIIYLFTYKYVSMCVYLCMYKYGMLYSIYIVHTHKNTHF